MVIKKPGQEKRTPTRGGSGGARAIRTVTVTVLHIDDDPNDSELLRAAVRKAGVSFDIHTVEDADEAIAYLNGVGVFADRLKYRLPSLILLDLKMPRANGFDMLEWIRRHPEIGSVPIIVLSGSELTEDMRKAYQFGANSYLVKPLGFAELVRMVQGVETSWLTGLQPARL